MVPIRRNPKCWDKVVHTKELELAQLYNVNMVNCCVFCESSRHDKIFIYEYLLYLLYIHTNTRWWFQICFISTLFGEDSHFDYIIFFKWVETTN